MKTGPPGGQKSPGESGMIPGRGQYYIIAPEAPNKRGIYELQGINEKLLNK